jgi:hypothetical protein
MERSLLIDHFEGGGERLALSIRGLTREDLLCVPPADAKVGLWSIQQVVIHCMDSDLVSVDRMKRMIAEDNPTLIGYDENKFAANLFYDEQDADAAAAIVDANRKLFAKVLRKLPETAWGRKGTHNERGVLTVGGYLKVTVDHLEHHLKFIHAKRAHWGKEMW